MQQSRYQLYLKVISIGTRLSYTELLLSYTELLLKNAHRSGCLKKVQKAINICSEGTDFHGKGVGSESDTRPITTNSQEAYDENSHRPDQVAYIQPGRVRNRPPTSSATVTVEYLESNIPLRHFQCSVQFPPPLGILILSKLMVALCFQNPNDTFEETNNPCDSGHSQ